MSQIAVLPPDSDLTFIPSPGEPDQVSVHVALHRILRDVQAIPKSERNAQQNYAFRGIDATVDALHNLFAIHGVVPLPTYRVTDMHTAPTRSGGSMEVITVEGDITFVGPMGDTLSVQTIGHASDAADKAANQAMQAALKYALFQTFLIPTGDPDADAKTLERAAGQSRSRAATDDAGTRPPAAGAGRTPSAPRPSGHGRGGAGDLATPNQRKALFAICRKHTVDLGAFLDAYCGKTEEQLGKVEAGTLIEQLNAGSINPLEVISRSASAPSDDGYEPDEEPF